MPSASDKRPAGPEPGKDLSFESIAAGEKASEAEDFVRDTIERRPYTAAAVALAVGNLLLTLFGGAWIILGNPPSRAKALELAARRSCFVVRA